MIYSANHLQFRSVSIIVWYIRDVKAFEIINPESRASLLLLLVCDAHFPSLQNWRIYLPPKCRVVFNLHVFTTLNTVLSKPQLM
jgi:hypothetical protein